ncbi:MAG TPA: hypothetical protein VF814_11610 [Casimicrobiaceae bacterium]
MGIFPTLHQQSQSFSEDGRSATVVTTGGLAPPVGAMLWTFHVAANRWRWIRIAAELGESRDRLAGAYRRYAASFVQDERNADLPAVGDRDLPAMLERLERELKEARRAAVVREIAESEQAFLDQPIDPHAFPTQYAAQQRLRKLRQQKKESKRRRSAIAALIAWLRSR